MKAVELEASYEGALPDEKPGVPTGLYPCPVTLTAEFDVGDPTTGWLILSRAAKPQAGQDVSQSLTAFRMTRVMSPSGYFLIALSALVVTAVAWIVTLRRNGDGPSFADAPVSSAILGALTAVSTGAIAWSGLAPGLDLGGIVVIGLAGGVLVAVGNTIASGSRKFGNAVAVVGMALIALLLPFVLLHAATIGWTWIAWLVVVLMLGFAVGYGPNAKAVVEVQAGPAKER
ncbi:MAG: hypothetical protein L0H78_19110 [Humibacillus sp.]|nr:hypothetical protein [Humibacillus sp.]